MKILIALAAVFAITIVAYRKKQIRILVALVAVLSVAIGALSYYMAMLQNYGGLELLQASVWADMQGIELSYRDTKNPQTPLMLDGAAGSGKYDVLGLPTKDDNSPYVWIIINTNAGLNGFYMMPKHTRFFVACAYVNDLNNKYKNKIDPLVQEMLASSCLN